MPKVILDQPRVRALVGQGEAASVAELVRTRRQVEASRVAVFSDRKPGGAPVEGLTLLAHKKRPAGRFHAGAFGKPGLDDALCSPRYHQGLTARTEKGCNAVSCYWRLQPTLPRYEGFKIKRG